MELQASFHFLPRGNSEFLHRKFGSRTYLDYLGGGKEESGGNAAEAKDTGDADVQGGGEFEGRGEDRAHDRLHAPDVGPRDDEEEINPEFFWGESGGERGRRDGWGGGRNGGVGGESRSRERLRGKVNLKIKIKIIKVEKKKGKKKSTKAQ